ncbi:hypothetical protein OIU77_017750 [Salix suchowensis]|uniref:Uncharacterized protein n=1 Tax=Salix suchowensis TaxID=1278906 RepID=A0ABQ8ZQ01_9ROSI|nr:hypothetical protein OIU77_017750 [Salix suchowensis]
MIQKAGTRLWKGKCITMMLLFYRKNISTEDVEGNLGDFELNIHGDNDATEAYSENTEFVVSKSFVHHLWTTNPSVRSRKKDDPESRLLKDGMRGEEQRVHCKDHGSESLQNIALATEWKTFIGIEEEKSEYSRYLTRDCRDFRSSSSKTNEETPYLEKDVEIDPTHLKNSGVFPKAGVSAEVSDKEIPVERNSHESMNSSSNSDIRRAGSRETNHNKRTPASPDQCISIPNETNHVALYSSQSKKDGTEEVQTMDIIAQGNQQMSLEVNGIHENVFHEGKKTTRQKHYRYCCLGSRYE